MIDVDKLYDLNAVADITSSPVPTVRKWAQTGEILAVKTGRAWKVRGDELQRMLNEGTRKPQKEPGADAGQEVTA